ncbi:MAG: FMN-binding protein [Acidimicrobiia bacterium]
MKRTLALVGLLVIGLLLLLDPDTGIVTATAQESTQTSVVVASPTTTTGAPPPPETSSTTTTSEPGDSSTTSSTTATSTTTTTAATTGGTFSIIGEAVPSPFGFFQVEVVFEDGVMTDIVTLEEPPDRRSQRINDSVIPIYEEEAISAQSSDFDVISGATVTWEAWGASLESALYEAGV